MMTTYPAPRLEPTSHRPAPAAPSAAEVTALAELFGALADPSRLRLVAELASGECSVSRLAAAVDLSQSAVSHQLRLLRHLGLVRTRRAGRLIYYALDDDHVLMLYRQGLDHVLHGRAGHRPATEEATA